jgi:hypothetical protein
MYLMAQAMRAISVPLTHSMKLLVSMISVTPSTLSSDLPLYIAVANDLCKDFVPRAQTCCSVFLIIHVDEEEIVSGADRA